MNKLHDILYRVQKPSQYLGREVHAYQKSPDQIVCRMVLAYPDLYEIGMSYLGLHVLYDALNRHPDIFAERVFAPYHDMQAELIKANIPLFSLETQTPLQAFDLVGFTLQHELNYPDVISMLHLGGIPVRSDQRTQHHPIVIAGGPCASNPEPLAPALDAVFLGDADESLIEIARIVGQSKREHEPRKTTLDRLMRLQGIYVPSQYQFGFDNQGDLKSVTSLREAPARIVRNVVTDINRIEPPTRVPVPCSTTIHERYSIEIQRGCTRGCRFCQAGMIHRPVRQRTSQNILKAVSQGLKLCGYEQASFLSLSAGDHGRITTILEDFFDAHAPKMISASLPSLRAETLTPRLAELLKTVRKSGFTIAPEAGTERLRRVINKQLSDDDVIKASVDAFEAGWELIKLYFMIGLPTEQPEDHDGIIDLVRRIKQNRPRSRRRNSIHVGLSIFVPKAHTPFQWEAMIEESDAMDIQKKLRAKLAKLGGVKVGFSKVDMAMVEGVLARGDRRHFEPLVSWSLAGGRLAAWTEHFQYHAFERAFGTDHRKYRRSRTYSEVLPWSHLEMGPTHEFLWQERSRAYQEKPTPDCSRSACYQCGACTENQAKPILDVLSEQNPPQKNIRDEKPKQNGKWLRLHLTKRGLMAHLSHIEYMKSITRALRRADWPLIFSQGFHPKPKISFGPACPVGCVSLAEWVDICIEADHDQHVLIEKLRDNLPDGIEIQAGFFLPDQHVTIMKEAIAVRYRLVPCSHPSISTLTERAQSLMRKHEWNISRIIKDNTKYVDIRPSILRLDIIKHADRVEVILDISLCNESSARPAEVAQELFTDLPVRVIRDMLLFQKDEPTTDRELQP